MEVLERLCTPTEPKLVEHNVISHAAHYADGGGHNLARWVVQLSSKPLTEQIATLGIPATAEYHSGYVHLGKQHWIYVEKRPLSDGYCPTCSARASERLFLARGLS